MSHEESEDNVLGELPLPNRLERDENAGYYNEGTRFDRFGGKSLLDNRDYGTPYDIRQENDVRSRPGEIGSAPRALMSPAPLMQGPLTVKIFLKHFF